MRFKAVGSLAKLSTMFLNNPIEEQNGNTKEILQEEGSEDENEG